MLYRGRLCDFLCLCLVGLVGLGLAGFVFVLLGSSVLRLIFEQIS
jgi:hypothetical protein